MAGALLHQVIHPYIERGSMPVTESVLLGFLLTAFQHSDATRVFPKFHQLGGWSVELHKDGHSSPEATIALRAKHGRHILSGVRFGGNCPLVKEVEVDLKQDMHDQWKDSAQQIFKFVNEPVATGV